MWEGHRRDIASSACCDPHVMYGDSVIYAKDQQLSTATRRAVASRPGASGTSDKISLIVEGITYGKFVIYGRFVMYGWIVPTRPAASLLQTLQRNANKRTLGWIRHLCRVLSPMADIKDSAEGGAGEIVRPDASPFAAGAAKSVCVLFDVIFAPSVIYASPVINDVTAPRGVVEHCRSDVIYGESVTYRGN